MIQFLHMQGDPFHFLSNVLNSEIFSVVLIPLLIEFHNLAPSDMKHFCPEYSYYISATLILKGPDNHKLYFFERTYHVDIEDLIHIYIYKLLTT